MLRERKLETGQHIVGRDDELVLPDPIGHKQVRDPLCFELFVNAIPGLLSIHQFVAIQNEMLRIGRREELFYFAGPVLKQCLGHQNQRWGCIWLILVYLAKDIEQLKGFAQAHIVGK